MGTPTAKMDIRTSGTPKRQRHRVPLRSPGFETPIDCQAIFTILPANIVGYMPKGLQRISLRHDSIAALEACFLAQDTQAIRASLFARATTTALQ